MAEIFQIIRWFLSILLILFFLLVASFNLWVAWREWILKRLQGPSTAPLVGGLAGYIGIKISPVYWLSDYAWLALIVDYGSVLYFTLALVFLIKEKLFERD